MKGQLLRKERRFLYDLVRDHKPSVCYEVGTYTGGGSTLTITSALSDNGHGVLFTAEINPTLSKQAEEAMDDEYPQLGPYVRFYVGDAIKVFRLLLEQNRHVDFVFLDGSEDPQETLAQMELFEVFSTPDTVFVGHDWGTSKKMELVKPLVDSGEFHQYVARIYPQGAGFEDGSVGIAAWRMKV